MKKILAWSLIVLTIFLSQITNAQQFSLGARGGISIPNLSASGSSQNPLNTGYKSRFGPDAAVTGEYSLSSLFSLEAMVEYSSQGGKKSGMQAFPTPAAMAAMFPAGQAPTYLYANFKSEAKMNYLMVPILAKFGWNFKNNSPLRVYVDAGPFAGFLLNAHQVTSGSSMVYADAQGQQPLTPQPQSFDSTTNIKSQLNTFNFGVSANVGLAYQMKKSKVFIEGGGNYGFLNIQKGTANGKNNTGAGTVDIGYAYTFGK